MLGRVHVYVAYLASAILSHPGGARERKRIPTGNQAAGTDATAEERLDTILLVVRNGVQFLRIVNILRRYVRVT